MDFMALLSVISSVTCIISHMSVNIITQLWHWIAVTQNWWTDSVAQNMDWVDGNDSKQICAEVLFTDWLRRCDDDIDNNDDGLCIS